MATPVAPQAVAKAPTPAANPYSATGGYATANGALPANAQPIVDPSNPYYSGMPTTPGFSPIYNASTQALSPGYDQQVAANSQGFDAFRDQALRQGPSAWATTALQQQALESENQKEKGIESTAGANAAANDSLAAQGGMSSGARERVAEGGEKNMLDMNQNVSRQENLNNLQIGMNDNQNKMQELSQLPGMEQSRVNAWETTKQGDLSNQLAENKSLNDYNQNIYNQQMNAWAADKQAKATASSGKK